MRIAVFLIAMLWAGCAWAVCTLPSGVEGEIIYNRDVKKVQYCDGTHWIGVGWKGVPTRAAGAFGQLQFNDGSGDLAASPKLAWNGDMLAVRGAADAPQFRVYNDETLRLTVYIRDGAVYLYGYEEEGSKTAAVGLGGSSTVTALHVTAGRQVGIGTKEPEQNLEVVGEVRVRGGASAHRYLDMALGVASSGTSCNAACGSKYCLGGYLDNSTNTKASCEQTTSARNCICIGR